MALPNEWTEIGLVDITKAGGSVYQFGVITDTVDIDWGDKAIESTALVNGGRIVKYTPEEDTTITLEMFPVGATANQATPTGLYNWFLGDESGTSGRFIATHLRYKFRVSLLWCDQLVAWGGTVAVASGSTPASSSALRFSFWNCYLTSVKTEFTDDLLKCTVKFVCPPYNKTASGMIATEEKETAALSAMSSYTATSTPSWS